MAEIRKPGPKFPPTRLLKAGYEDIVPNDCHSEEVTKALNELVHSTCFETNSRPNHTIHPSEIGDNTLCNRTEKLKATLEQQIVEMNQSIRLQEEVIQKSLPNIQTLIRVSKFEPSLTAVTLNYCSLTTPTLSRVRQCGIVRCCKCSQQALPFTRFCTKHIHRSRDQFLYRCCTSSNVTTKEKCDNPVPDILSASNTCHKHYRPADLAGMATLKRGVIRGGIGKGGSRTKITKILPKKTPLPNILKSHRDPPNPVHQPTIVHPPKGPPPPPTISDPPKGRPTIAEPPTDNSLAPRSSLDDLLTLPPPLQSLNLPPLEADLGDIMMAGEEDGN